MCDTIIPKPRSVPEWLSILAAMQGSVVEKYHTIRETENFLNPNGPPPALVGEYKLAVWLSQNWPKENSTPDIPSIP